MDSLLKYVSRTKPQVAFGSSLSRARISSAVRSSAISPTHPFFCVAKPAPHCLQGKHSLMTTREQIVAAARGWIGTPYHHQASVKGVGCDCLGLIRGLW